MKFKTEKNLINEESNLTHDGPDWVIPFKQGKEHGIDIAFKSFKERVRFYESNCVEETFSVYYAFEQLKKKQEHDPDLFTLWKKQKTLQWNEWFFKYCSRGIK